MRSPRKIHVPYLVMAGDPGAAGRLDRCIRRCPKSSAERGQCREQRRRIRGAAACSQFPHLWLGVLCLFVYVGVEVMAGDAIGTYGRGFDLPLDQTKFFTSFTLAAMLVGYVVGLADDSALHLAAALPGVVGGARRACWRSARS